MHLAIVGCGALGSFFAAALSSQTELTMLGHWPEQILALRAAGLILIQPDGSLSSHHFEVTNDPGQMPVADLCLVLVKAYQTERAAREIDEFLASDGLAVTMQNGLGNVEILAGILGPDRVTQGITAVGAAMVEPGSVRFAGHGPTHLAQSPVHYEALAVLSNWMNAANLETHLARDVQSLAWGKLVINSGINPLSALLRVPNGFLAADMQARRLMYAAAEETAAVAQALQIALPYADPRQRILEVAQATAVNYSSMLQDVRRGSQTEIDAICGAVVKYGRLADVPTPLNSEFLRLIRALPTRKPEQPLKSSVASLQTLLDQTLGE